VADRAVWRRRGLLLDGAPSIPWARSHAALPTVAPRRTDDGAPYDLYLATRDERNRAHVARVALHEDADGALRVGAAQEAPALAPGELGAFDDSGVTVSCVVDRADGDRLMYYSGWSLGVTVPFYFYVGLAVSADGGATFTRVSRGPVLGRNDADPFLTASPSVHVENGTWRMWYISASGWERTADGPRHHYHVRYAESDDGVVWRHDGRVAVELAGPDEHAHGRPCVTRDPDGTYHMYFCARGADYRLAHASSTDGLSWERDDVAATLVGAPGAWETDATAYPFVFDASAGPRMLYNGNGYGATGVGWADLAQDAQ
jgi:hypothetical protein